MMMHGLANFKLFKLSKSDLYFKISCNINRQHHILNLYNHIFNRICCTSMPLYIPTW